MKTFQEFMSLCEASDADAASQLGWGGGVSITRQGDGGRIGKERRKTAPERRRVKAVGGGKTEPVVQKPRKDIGQQRGSTGPAPGRGADAPALKPGTAGTQGSATMSAKERQRKAYLERKAKERGEAQPKTASQALSKPKSTTPSDYKPRKASGLSTQERKALYKKGERKLRDLVLSATGKKSEKELQHKYTSK